MIGISGFQIGGYAAWRTNAVYRNQNRQSAAPVEETAPAVPSGNAQSLSPLPVTALPTEQDLNNAADNLVRMRIQFPGQRKIPDAVSKAVDLMNNLMGVEKPESPSEVMEETECQTCAKRKYQDGSDDPGVSFKTPTAMDPDQAATAVRGHEQEHVVRERAEAAREGKKVVSQSVTIHTDICPECGRVYVSGGVTETVTASKPENNQAEKNGAFEAFA